MVSLVVTHWMSGAPPTPDDDLNCFQMLPNVPQMPKLPQDENRWSKLATREIQDEERGLSDSL